MGLRDELLTNIKNFYSSAKLVYDNEDYTSAFILYFKALVALADYHLFSETGKIPKDHQERFRELEKLTPELYRIVDRFFPYYRKSYSTSLKKEICNEVIYYVKLFAKKFKIQGID